MVDRRARAQRRRTFATALLALIGLPFAAAATDLQISGISDVAYENSPAGAAVTYSITIGNGGTRGDNVVSIYDLPAGTTAGTLPGFCTIPDASAPRRVRCDHGTLNLDEERSFDLQVLTAGLPPGNITIAGAIGFDTGASVPTATTPVSSLNTSTDPFFATDTNRNNNYKNESTTLINSGDLELTKVANPSPVMGGAEVTYDLTVRNLGPSTSTGFRVVDALPGSVTYVAGSFSGSNWSAPSVAGGSLTTTYSGPALAVGQTATFRFRAKVNIGTGNIVNTADVEAGPTADPVPGNNTAQVITPVTDGADVRISKDASPKPATAGQPVTFTLTVTNDGPSDAQNVAFADEMPEGFVITAGNQPSGWTCSTDTDNRVRSCQTPTLAMGDTATFTITATVPSTGANSSGDVTNTVAVTSSTPDPAPANNTGSVTFTVLPDGADLSLVSKTKTPSLVAIWKPGDADPNIGLMTSTMQVRNLGPRVATSNVQITDTLAEGEEFMGVGAASTQWSCAAVPNVYTPGTPQQVTCTLDRALAVNANAQNLVLTTRARAASASLANRACTGGSGGSGEPVTGAIDFDNNPANDCSGWIGARTSDERADLQITKTATTPSGDRVLDETEGFITYTLTVTNHGPDATSGIVINDTIPGYIATSGSLPQGTTITTTPDAIFGCSASGASVVCRSGGQSLANGASASVQVRVNRGLLDSIGRASANCGGETVADAWCNTATVGIESQYAGSVGEVNTANNQDSDWVRVQRVTNVTTASKTVSPATGQIGVDTTYSIAYRNNGPSAAPDVVFRDVFTLPAGDAGFVLRSMASTVAGSTCTATHGDGIVRTASAGGDSFAATGGGADYTITVQCTRVTLARNSGQSLNVVIRPNIGSGNAGRSFTNVADFFFDFNNDGVPDPASDNSPGTGYNYNSTATAADDSKTATLTFTPGSVNLITNKIDRDSSAPFTGGIDPLGFDAMVPDNNFITYRITVQNTGPSVATNVRIADTLTPPANRQVRFVGASATPGGTFDPGACSVVAGSNPVINGTQTLDCLMPGVGFSTNVPGVVNNGATSTLYLRYRYETPPGAGGDTMFNEAEASAAEANTSGPGSYRADEDTTIRARADMGVAKTMVTALPSASPDVALPASVTQVSLREPFFYVMTATNHGPGASLSRDRGGSSPLNGTGTVLTDTLPAGVVVTGDITWQKVGPDPGGDEVPEGSGLCSRVDRQITCNLGDVTVTGRVRVIVPARWDTYPPGGTSTNHAAVATEQVDLVPGNDTIDVPLAVVRSTIQGVVFEDRDRSTGNGGIRNDATGEPGITSVTVRLTGTDAYGNAVDHTVVTATDGSYSFDNLSPSDASGYTLTQVQPTGYVNGPIAPPTSGGNAPSLGGAYATGAPDSSYTGIAVGANQTGVRYDFPEVRRPSLSGFVYVDGNFNNVRNAGDAAIAGARVELLDAAGTLLTFATTDANGAYRFDDLDPLQTYQLREALPTGNYRNRATAVNPGLVGGMACATCTAVSAFGGDEATTDRIRDINLGTGQDGVNFNFGEDAIAGISGTVYLDRNRNGDFDAADAGTRNSQPNGGLQDVELTLTGAGADGVFGNGDDPAPVVVRTDASGQYQFANLIVGQRYRVTETQPDGYASGAEAPLDVLNVASLPVGGSSGLDFGETLGVISGFVYEDFSATAANNNNGAFDASENPIGSVTLRLTGMDVVGNPVDITLQTDALGAYAFTDLLPPTGGTGYTITQTQPAGYIDGRHTAGNASTPGNTSTANVIDGIAISEGQQASGYLFGELANALISGRVYLDRNDDGDYATGDIGVPGVTVVIEGAGVDGVFGNGDDPAPVTLTTNASGEYSYGGAVAGQSYRIRETQPTGLGDGQENNSNLITVTNLPATGSTDNDFGEEAASIAGNVWLDLDNDGVRDAGENGIAGVSVSLPAGTIDALGNVVVAVLTDANGNYRFDDLLAGIYAVTQQQAQPVVGGQTTVNGTTIAGTIDGVTSGAATNVATTPSAITGIVLNAAAASVQNNFAETLGVSVSGRVFFDANNDGAQSGAAETGIEGVEIQLVGEDDTGVLVNASTTTDANGGFEFTGLRPGIYTLIEPEQPAGTSNGQTVPGNINGVQSGAGTAITYVPSRIVSINLLTPGNASVENLFGEIPLNSSISGRVWRDLDNDGVIDSSETGIDAVVIRLQGTDLSGTTVTRETTTGPDGSYAFTGLPPGTYTITEPDQPQGTLNGRTVAGNGGGIVTPPTTAPSVISDVTLGVGENVTGNDFGEIPAGSIRGRVYNDANNNGNIDANEPGIAQVDVVLSGINELGETVNVTVTTDAEGRYRFDGLRPGTYTVTEPQQPPHTLNGITRAGTIDGVASGTATGVATTPSAISGIVLLPGNDSIENNFGEIGDSPDLVVSKTATPTTFTVNNIGTYTVRVRNLGQQPSAGEYVVDDILPAGLTLAATPSGNGWICVGNPGEGRFSCRNSTVIAAGATLADTIIAQVRVAASAATGTPINNAVIVTGGGENEFRRPTLEERLDFEGNPGDLPVCDPAISQNACRLPTPVQLAASVSGTVWFDQGQDFGVIDGGDRRLADWRVEVVDAEGRIVGEAITAADGSYSIADQIPGIPLQIRFRDPQAGVIWGWPVNGETRAAPVATCRTQDAIGDGTASSCRSSENGNTVLAVVLAAGANLPQQSLPLNPGGVVYDAVSRNPVPGSRVSLLPIGACPAYAPATHLLNVAGGGYTIDGQTASMIVGNEGFYQFLMAPSAPASCRFRMEVTPPAGYAFQSSMIPAETAPLNPPSTPGVGYPVQTNATAPTGPVGSATTYYLETELGSAVAAPVHNHIPLDPQIAPGLVITKTGDRKTVEVGDSLVYTITIRQTAGAALGTVNVIDRLPHGFTFIAGTARVDGAGIADPSGKPGPTLVFDVGSLAVGAQKTLSYRVRVGVGSQQGDGINRAQAWGCSITGGCVDAGTQAPYPNGGVVPSNRAEYRVVISGGVFADEGCVLGKIFVDCNVNHVQDSEELGIPGVRLYFEDGTWLISDSEGKYSYCGLPPKSHTLKVDASTLPVGSRLTTSSNRNLGDADSLFIDLKNGELHRADFIEGSCSSPVIEQVKARRTQGEVRAPENESGRPSLRFESKPLRSPQQATDSADQKPIVDPRPSRDDATEVQP